MPRTRSKSNRKSTPKKAKASAANMPVDAALALNITRFYSMAFFIGLTMFTDQFAAAYQVEVSTKNKIFMAFLGLNGFFAQCATNTFVGRIGHKKTMSLTCFANIVVFGLFTLHQTKTEYIDEVPFSDQDRHACQYGCGQHRPERGPRRDQLHGMGLIRLGHAKGTRLLERQRHEQVQLPDVATCLFFGVLSYFMTDTLLEMYKVDPPAMTQP